MSHHPGLTQIGQHVLSEPFPVHSVPEWPRDITRYPSPREGGFWLGSVFRLKDQATDC